MLPNTLLACVVEVAVVGGGKILAPLEVLLLLLPLIADMLDGLLNFLLNPWIAGIGVFDDINATLQDRPSVRPLASIAMKWAMAGRAAGLVGTYISTAVPSNGVLSVAGIHLGREGLAHSNSLPCNGPDVDNVLCFETNGQLENFLEDLG